jgi:predicted nuclease of restriction endonuclease-like RecB superfamily
MAFRINDFKKTVRGQGPARQVYPYQIRDDRFTAAIGFTINYFERMAGRKRAEFEADALLEFFGDPKLARGIVACLNRSYTWRTPTFREHLGEQPAALLREAGVDRPLDLRTRLYGLANGRYGGFLSKAERPEALSLLCEIMDGSGVLQPALLEQGLTLDGEEQRVLVKIGATPTPAEIVARYNFHSLDTALINAEEIQLTLSGDIWALLRSVHNLARRYRLSYRLGEAPRSLFDQQFTVVLSGGRDALGEARRAGRRLARALLRLLASHPGAIQAGEATLHLGGRNALLRLDERVLTPLGALPEIGAVVGEMWQEDPGATFRQAWGRAFLAKRTGGWRLRRDPEPLVGVGGLIVPDFAARRGNEVRAVCLVTGKAMAEGLASALKQVGTRFPVLIITPEHLANQFRNCPAAIATYGTQPSDALAQVVALLEERQVVKRAA